MSHSEPCLTSRMAGSLPGLWVNSPGKKGICELWGGQPCMLQTEPPEACIYVRGSPQFPCPPLPLACDTMPVTCSKPGGQGLRLQSCNPSLAFTLDSHPFLSFNLREESFWRGGPSHLVRTQFFHYPENSTRYPARKGLKLGILVLALQIWVGSKPSGPQFPLGKTGYCAKGHQVV